MDFAGAGFVREDAMEDTEPARFLDVRDGEMSRALVYPTTADVALVPVEDLGELRPMMLDQKEDDAQESSRCLCSAGRSDGIQSSA